MNAITQGGNAPLPSTTLKVGVSGPVDVTALVVNADGKVASDADMVFFNQPSAPGVALTGTTLELDLTALRPGAEKVVVAASPESAASFRGLQAPVVTVEGGPVVTPPAFGDETVVVLAEFYSRGGAWKVRAVGQGYTTGLAGLASDFGVDVDSDPASTETTPAGTTSAQPVTPTQGVPKVRLVKGEEKLSAKTRDALNLRKEKVVLSLVKNGVGDVRARVIVVLDCSGSMSELYRSGVVARIVERMVPVAAQLDDDGSMQAWRFADSASQVPDLEVADMESWIPTYVVMDSYTPFGGGGGGFFGRKKKTEEPARLEPVGFGNSEEVVIASVRSYVKENPLDVPTLVLFYSDGGIYNNGPIEAQLKAASNEPIFWQFVGLGNANYGVLERLDTLDGRAVDSTGFFSVDDIDSLADEDLYDRILQEFPLWIKAANSAGILK
jgi:stress response protein SCP2